MATHSALPRGDGDGRGGVVLRVAVTHGAAGLPAPSAAKGDVTAAAAVAAATAVEGVDVASLKRVSQDSAASSDADGGASSSSDAGPPIDVATLGQLVPLLTPAQVGVHACFALATAALWGYYLWWFWAVAHDAHHGLRGVRQRVLHAAAVPRAPPDGRGREPAAPPRRRRR